MLKNTVLLILLFFPVSGFSVETKIISESGYKNLWLWQLSNTALTDAEGISLAKESIKEFSTPSILWTMQYLNDKPYYAAADTARIFTTDTKGLEQNIYSNTNKTLISALAPLKNGFIAVSAPDAELLRFDNNNNLITNMSLSNTYVWDFVTRPDGGLDILASLPAQIYTYTNDILSAPILFPDEEHLIHGIYIGNTLWILSEKALYKKEGTNITAVAAFNGTAANFTYANGMFYVIQSIPIPSKNPEEKEQVQSFLLSVSRDGVVNEILSLPGFYFTAVYADNNTIYVGGDQYGLTISYNLTSKKTLYSALGAGKVLSIMKINKKLKVLTTDDSALWTIENKTASQGEFISEIYDTGVSSSWGILSASTSILPGTDIKFYIQSGVVKNPVYWSNWVEVRNGAKIPSSPGRYIRYKAVLSSTKSGISPNVYGVNFPYTQENLPPKVEKITVERRGTSLTASWNASDPNKDTLEYDIYVHDIGMKPIKLNPDPLNVTNFTFPNEALASGLKKITISVSDLPSNTPETALKSELSSLPIIFDSEVPLIGNINVSKRDNNTALVSFTVKDNISPIKSVLYLINGRSPKNIRPNDGIYDGLEESFSIRIPREGFIQFQVTDSANNTASKGIFIP